MIRTGLLTLAVLGVAESASAQASLSIQLETDAVNTLISATYSCARGDAFPVQYVEAGPNALAVLPIDGQERVFVNVVSGSGMRYVSGQYVWWSKGRTATLENELEEGSSMECVSEDYPATE